MRATGKTLAEEKAQRAVSAFRRLQPTLNAYARNLTGRPDIRIVVAAQDNGSTDGKKIYFRPPIELGNEVPHVRSQCNKRSDDMQLACPACASREGVLGVIYHEIAHIWFDSFASVNEYNKKLALERAIKDHSGKYADEVRERINSKYVLGYMPLASLVNEYFPFLINCLEDARVNRELFKALPGTEVMFHANVCHTFAEGVEQVVDGDWKKIEWRDYPLNSQVMLGTFCMASGYDYTDWFAPVVEAALRDMALTALVEEAATQYSVGDIFKAAFPILTRLRELGFCKPKYEPEEEPTPPPTDSTEGESNDDKSSESEEERKSVPEAEGQSSDRGSDESDDSDSGTDDGSGGEPEYGESSGNDAEGSSSADSDSGKSSGGDSDDSGMEDDGTAGGEDNARQEDVSDSDTTGEPSDGDEPGGSGESDTGSNDTGQHGNGGLDGTSGDDGAGGDRNADESADADLDSRSGDTESRSEAPSGDTTDSLTNGDVDDELIDTGDFEYGTRLEGDFKHKDGSDLPMGSPEEVRIALVKLGDHEEKLP